jgi:hypothetical protein
MATSETVGNSAAIKENLKYRNADKLRRGNWEEFIIFAAN